MRVICGSAKKRRLKSPGKLPVRPTSDRVKESLFNIIANYIPNCCFADFYAGTGGIGIEALSRGAKKAVFVEKNSQVARILKDNIITTGFGAQGEIMVSDVGAAIKQMSKRNEIFDIIFADPPYRQGLAYEMLNILNRFSLLQHNGLLVLETGVDEELPQLNGRLSLWRREKYGDTALVFYKPVIEEDMFCE